MLSDRTLAYGARIMQAVLGIDRLYRDESGDESGLVVLNMDTEGRYPADRFVDYGDARAAFHALKDAAADLHEPDRARYYEQLCRSTLAFVDGRTVGLPFRTRLRDFLHVPASPASDDDSTRSVRSCART